MHIEPIELERKLLRKDGGTQPREALDQDHIQDIVVALKNRQQIDAILAYYDGSNYWLTDGFHRDAAHEIADLPTIRCEVRSGTQKDAQWHSFSVNQHQVLKRSNADKQRAVIGALKHPYALNKSDVEIAAHCGVSAPNVGNWRSKLEWAGEIPKTEKREVVRGGTSYSQNVGGLRGKTEDKKPEAQKFKVACADTPYYGQEVELVEIKSGDCYHCKLSDGSIYPFFKSELVAPGQELKPIDKQPVPTIKPIKSNRERLMEIVSQLPEEFLEEAIAVLTKRFNLSKMTQLN